ncbi:helix-turn-helix domain-containing protein [Streptomyces sp. NPDC003300]|uniref:helix-turn-helix domain-containing protein n=1 Tax=unclassified Streptomyces TaxID=2593676 RepID=UPI0033A93E69
MSVRPDIAALIAAGHTDTGIAARLGIDRTTANKARHELRWRSRTPDGQLALESVPTGAAFKPRPWTAAEQAAHRAELLAALGGAPLNVRARTKPRRHLHALPPAA